MTTSKFKKVFCIALLATLAIGCGKDNKSGSAPAPAPAPAPVTTPSTAVSNLTTYDNTILAPYIQNHPYGQMLVQSFNQIVAWRQNLRPETEGSVHSGYLKETPFSIVAEDPDCKYLVDKSWLKIGGCVEKSKLSYGTPIVTCLQGQSANLQIAPLANNTCQGAAYQVYNASMNTELSRVLSLHDRTLYLWDIVTNNNGFYTIVLGNQQQPTIEYSIDVRLHSAYNPTGSYDFVNKTGVTLRF